MIVFFIRYLPPPTYSCKVCINMDLVWTSLCTFDAILLRNRKPGLWPGFFIS